jgi:cytoskeleton protein RodZ
VAGPPAAAPVAGVLQLRASAESWVEVIDGRGQSLLSRVLVPGETVGLDGAMPMKLTIGNAGATEVSFRGRPVDLSGRVRDNVARLDLK